MALSCSKKLVLRGITSINNGEQWSELSSFF